MKTPYPLPLLRTLPLREQPGARVRSDSTACTTLELLASVIGGPRQIEIAQRLLTHFGSLHQVFAASALELADLDGIGPTTAARLKAALELGTRLAASPSEQRRQIRSPHDAAQLLIPELNRLEQEHFCVVLLDTRRYVIEVVTLYVGSVNQQVIRIAEVFREAIRRNATALILAHNHPSADCEPSQEDLATSKAIVKAGRLLDLDVVDHLIIAGRGQHKFVSLKDRGIDFDE